MKILTNPLGYKLNGPKHAAFLEQKLDHLMGFQVKHDETGDVVFSRIPTGAIPSIRTTLSVYSQ